MPKLKVPTTSKPVKKQLTLFELKRRSLHNSNAGKPPETNSVPLMEKTSQHIGLLPTVLSPKKQNGLKSISKSFADVFGDSDDEADTFAGFSELDIPEEYRVLAETCDTEPPDKPTERETSSQRPVREVRTRKGRDNLYLSMDTADDQELDSGEIRSSSPCVHLYDEEMGKSLIPDNCSDSSWEADGSKSARKSSRPKMPPRPLLIEDGSDVPLRKRGVRCMECVACLRKEDCGQCEMCRDKRKFGGPGIKKQACVYRKCHNLVRDVPLKVKPKRVFIPTDSPPPPPKRSTAASFISSFSSEPGPLQASPLKSKRFTLAPDRSLKDKTDIPTVQLHWPTESDLTGVPTYSIRPSTKRPSACLKCGSSGKMEMVRCVVCCLVFHKFCVEELGSGELFTCPNCITCLVCGRGNNCIQCCKCKKWFHEYCLSSHQSFKVDGTWRCVGCTRCTSCKTSTPGKRAESSWYEDFKYCVDCFNLKQKGNYCPVCGECYSDSDYESKMVQCGKCDHWIHAHCEKMSDDCYEILSILPESVVFLCKLCGSEEERKEWQNAVEEYFHSSIAKLLSCVMKVAKYCNGLSDMEEKISRKEFTSTVSDFKKEIQSHLDHVLTKNKSGSVAYKTALAIQNDYLDKINELFPWLEEGEASEKEGCGPRSEGSEKAEGEGDKDKGEVGGVMEGVNPSSGDTTPMSVRLEWPALLTHDHCYTFCFRPDQPVAGKGSYPCNTKVEVTEGDCRRCMLCPMEGDAGCDEAGRLISCGVDEWVHVNCAIWSAEVYEENSGILCCVHTAISRGMRMRCDLCKEPGATVGCCTSTCSANYHFQCARRSKCLFLANKQVFCWTHHEQGVETEVAELPEEHIAVRRCVIVDTNPDRPGRKISRTLEVSKAMVQIGSIQVDNLGSLVELSDTPDVLLPDKYRASCEYWNVSSPSEVTRYTLTISAPEEEDWLMAPPITPPTSPSKTSPSAANDIGYQSVTVGGPPPLTWDSLASPPKVRKRITNPVRRKARIKNADSAVNIKTLMSLLHPSGAVVGTLDPSHKNDELCTDGRRPVDIRIINSTARNNFLSNLKVKSATNRNTDMTSHIQDRVPPYSTTSTTSTKGPSILSPASIACPLPLSQAIDRPGDPLPVICNTSTCSIATMATTTPCSTVTMATATLLSPSKAQVDSFVVKETKMDDLEGTNVEAMEIETSSISKADSTAGLANTSSDDILKTAMSATLLTGISGTSTNVTGLTNALMNNEELFRSIVADPTCIFSAVTESCGLALKDLVSMAKDGTRSHESSALSKTSSETGLTSERHNSTDVMESTSSGVRTGNSESNASTSNLCANVSSGLANNCSGITSMSDISVVTNTFANSLTSTNSCTSSDGPGTGNTSRKDAVFIAENPTCTVNTVLPATSLTDLKKSADLSGLLNSLANSANQVKSITVPPPMLALPPSTLNVMSSKSDSSNVTLVPIISDSQLYLCPWSTDTSVSVPSSSLNYFPNSSAVKSFKIPKKHTPPKPRPSHSRTSRPSLAAKVPRPLNSVGESSDEAVMNSVCLKRKKCNLSTVPHALHFSIKSSSGHEWKSHDLKDVWESVLAELEEQRVKLDLPYVPYNRDVYHQFGLTHPLVVQLVEQLPHANRCSNYKFSYHKPSELSSWKAHRPLINLTGCSRSEKFNGVRSPRDMFSFLMSDLRPVRPNLDLMALEYAVVTAEITGGAKMQSASDLPMAMRYRTLQKMYKQHVGVFQSDIHGLGLYCTKDIEPGEMVIEYAGTVIRSVLTDKREKLYDSKGIGCYMFRIDADEVVDATMSGNEARFINHACEPNCYSKVITVDGNKKIMIFALRRIVPGEELTYDYKFPKEDAKIPCNCGSKRCRKTMN